MRITKQTIYRTCRPVFADRGRLWLSAAWQSASKDEGRSAFRELASAVNRSANDKAGSSGWASCWNRKQSACGVPRSRRTERRHGRVDTDWRNDDRLPGDADAGWFQFLSAQELLDKEYSNRYAVYSRELWSQDEWQPHSLRSSYAMDVQRFRFV